MKQDPRSEKPTNVLRVIASTLAAAFGVQSSKNREHDFANGNFKVYVIAGILFTALFVTTVIGLAKLAQLA